MLRLTRNLNKFLSEYLHKNKSRFKFEFENLWPAALSTPSFRDLRASGSVYEHIDFFKHCGSAAMRPTLLRS